MAPIKFDEHIKEKLEQRELQPTSKTWLDLADKLEAEEKQNKSKVFWWLGIAASLVLLVTFSMQFFKAETESTQEILVETEIEQPIIKTETVPVQVEENKTETEVAIIEKPVLKQKKQTIKPKQLTTIQPSKNLVAKSETKTQKLNTTTKPKEENKLLKFEDVKVNDVVAEIKKIQKNNKEVTNNEIDSLLKAAQKDILKQRFEKETTRTVNADDLLDSVEEEIEDSFRTKVFKALNKRYKKVKTAVANRNN